MRIAWLLTHLPSESLPIDLGETGFHLISSWLSNQVKNLDFQHGKTLGYQETSLGCIRMHRKKRKKENWFVMDGRQPLRFLRSFVFASCQMALSVQPSVTGKPPQTARRHTLDTGAGTSEERKLLRYNTTRVSAATDQEHHKKDGKTSMKALQGMIQLHTTKQTS